MSFNRGYINQCLSRIWSDTLIHTSAQLGRLPHLYRGKVTKVLKKYRARHNYIEGLLSTRENYKKSCDPQGVPLLDTEWKFVIDGNSNLFKELDNIKRRFLNATSIFNVRLARLDGTIGELKRRIQFKNIVGQEEYRILKHIENQANQIQSIVVNIEPHQYKPFCPRNKESLVNLYMYEIRNNSIAYSIGGMLTFPIYPEEQILNLSEAFIKVWQGQIPNPPNKDSNTVSDVGCIITIVLGSIAALAFVVYILSIIF